MFTQGTSQLMALLMSNTEFVVYCVLLSKLGQAQCLRIESGSHSASFQRAQFFLQISHASRTGGGFAGEGGHPAQAIQSFTT